MPPKRSKAVAAPSSSQPLPETKARGGRKRRHSDGSNASVVSEAPSASSAPKRRKKGKSNVAEAEVIIEEEIPVVIEEEAEEEVVVAQPSEPLICEITQTHLTEPLGDDGVADDPSRHVHFGSDGDGANGATTQLRMPIKRRSTLSPAISPGSTRRIKTTRTSLPPALAEDGTIATTVTRELQYSTLRDVLDERIRRLQEQHKTGRVIDHDMLDELMVLDKHVEDVKYPALPASRSTAPATPTAFGRLRSLLTRVDRTDIRESESTPSSTHNFEAERRSWEQERKRFQDAILALSHEAEDAKARLHILSIELESFGFAEGTSPAVILQSIRDSFEISRELFETELVGTLPEGASFKDIIEILISNIKEFVARLRVQDKELQEKDEVITDLSSQVEGLLDHLAQIELRKSTLEQQWRELDETNDEQTRSIEQLEEELALLRDERDGLQNQLVVKTEEADVFLADKTDLEQSLERLSKSLQHYRDEEARLTGLIGRMEKEHATTVAHMNRERQETVQDLEDRLDAEAARLTTSEQTSTSLQTTITKLEKRVETIIVERDTLTQELAEARTECDAEAELKEAYEGEVQKRMLENEELEERVDSLDRELEELHMELNNLRELNESERTQRETAEVDLDDRNVEIEELNEKLRASGKQANELRQKLFEVQQSNKVKVEELEVLMAERDDQFQTDMATEVERREHADDLAKQRAITILELETRLEEVEREMTVLVREKDERILELEDLVADRDKDIEVLEVDIRQAEDAAKVLSEQHRTQTDELTGSIAVLRQTIEEHETTIRSLEQDAVDTGADHDAEIEERNTSIVQLNATVTNLHLEIRELQAQKAGLERRVEDEAEQMLTLQNENADEIETLQGLIRDKQAKILVVQDKAHEADRRWKEVIDAREEELSALRSAQSSSEETIETVTSQNVEIRGKFEAYVRRASGLIASLRQALAEAQAAVDEEGGAFVGEGEGLLEELAAMMAVSEVRTTTTKHTRRSSVSSQVASAKKVKGRQKRIQDSGAALMEE